jgi:hypothetical protein
MIVSPFGHQGGMDPGKGQRSTGEKDPERLSIFSGAVFAVRTAILVLELRTPRFERQKALVSLGSRLSSAVICSSLCLANHHHLMSNSRRATLATCGRGREPCRRRGGVYSSRTVPQNVRAPRVAGPFLFGGAGSLGVPQQCGANHGGQDGRDEHRNLAGREVELQRKCLSCNE